MKPTIVRNRMLYESPMHLASKQLASPLSDELQEKYKQNSARVVEGDSVKVLRGEFKGIEGKVTSVSTLRRGIAIEGIKREKLKGGNVDIFIHPSNVMITVLNLEDKWRQSRLEGQKPRSQKQKPVEDAVKPKDEPKVKKESSKPKDEKKESSSKPKDEPKVKKEEKKDKNSKQKETKAAEKPKKDVQKPQKGKGGK
ncbi:MAG: 50S ribosomal protein L24 [Thaumarchaeota archaeon]|nr:50S ribosomal protein L24 [Nitrososphaerota archaeon]